MADEIEEETERTCTSCKELRPITDYHLNKRCKGGRRAQCKFCVNSKRTKIYYDNRRGTFDRTKKYDGFLDTEFNTDVLHKERRRKQPST